jgi:hypothetical protein
MPSYVIMCEHAPDTCPSANTRVRSHAEEGLARLMPKLAEQAGVSFRLPFLHLDPGHRFVAVVEAPAMEVVTKMVRAAGLPQWNTVEVCPATPVAELMASQDGLLPPLYS